MTDARARRLRYYLLGSVAVAWSALCGMAYAAATTSVTADTLVAVELTLRNWIAVIGGGLGVGILYLVDRNIAKDLKVVQKDVKWLKKSVLLIQGELQITPPPEDDDE